MIILSILKGLFLTLAITYGFSNIGKILFARHNNISSFQIWMMSIGIAGVITLHYWI